MNIVLLILTLPFAALGVYCLGYFLLWFFTGEVVGAKIVSFSEEKSWGRALPVVVFEADGASEELVETQVEGIDRWSYWFNRPREDMLTLVVYKKNEPKRARVYGFINLVLGVLLFAPLAAVQAYRYGDALAQSQLLYGLMFVGMFFGGWVVLKLIQRS